MNFATVTSNMTRRARTALLVGCSLAGTLGVAQAATASDSVALSDAVPTAAVVNYGDLNLATAAGARTLYQRLATAAQEVCPIQDAWALSGAGGSEPHLPRRGCRPGRAPSQQPAAGGTVRRAQQPRMSWDRVGPSRAGWTDAG